MLLEALAPEPSDAASTATGAHVRLVERVFLDDPAVPRAMAATRPKEAPVVSSLREARSLPTLRIRSRLPRLPRQAVQQAVICQRCIP